MIILYGVKFFTYSTIGPYCGIEYGIITTSKHFHIIVFYTLFVKGGVHYDKQKNFFTEELKGDNA